MTATNARAETATITEMVMANPDVDNREMFAKLYGALTEIHDEIVDRFDVEPHPSSADYHEWSNDDGSFKGSLNTYSGEELDWFVHSWAGNPEKSILDMNINVWLGPHIDVPHLVLVFGTVPKLYHYSDLLARRELATHPDYLSRYYEAENQPFLDFRSDDRFHWSVSHGTYMRAILSPVAYSFMGDRTEDVADELARRARARFDRWLELVEQAQPVPVAERGALRRRDRRFRELTYTQDPMNKLAEQWLGPDLVDELVKVRYGHAQIHGGQ